MRAPWKWDWRRISTLAVLCGVGFGVATAWPLLWNILGVWLFLWIRAGGSQPRSPTGAQTPLEGKEAGHRVDHDRTGVVHIVHVTQESNSRRHRT